MTDHGQHLWHGIGGDTHFLGWDALSPQQTAVATPQENNRPDRPSEAANDERKLKLRDGLQQKSDLLKISRLRDRELLRECSRSGDKKTWQLDVICDPGLGEKTAAFIEEHYCITDKIWIHCELDCGIVVKTPDLTTIFCLSKKISLFLRK